jgi:glycerophosphoryl diester phosphodiesterase
MPILPTFPSASPLRTLREIAFGFILLIFPAVVFAQTVVPLPNAHAHNDYEHPHPLFDALSQGFTSIEADVHLIDGKLYVSHDTPEHHHRRKLKKLYLKPLKKQVKKNKGKVHRDDPSPVLLMIDVKTEAETTYQALKKELHKYADMLNFPGHPGPITVVLSGNRAIATVQADAGRMVSIDGRPTDLEQNYPTDLMPLISDNYANVVKWKGQGMVPEAELANLHTLAEKAHAQGKKVRLWASPENEAVWEALLRAGADLISTDQLEALRVFLSKKLPTKP